jgi:hypothetical protein
MSTALTSNLSMVKANTGTNEPWSNDNLNNNWDKLDKSIGLRTPKFTTTTVSNTVSETTVHTGIVPAISVQGATFSIRVWGNYDNSASASSFTVRAKLGGVQLTAFTITTPASLQTNNGWWADAQVVAAVLGGGGVGAWRTCLRGIKSDSASGTTTIVAIPGATTIVDNTVSQALQITVQWANASASNTVRTDAGLYRVDYNA